MFCECYAKRQPGRIAKRQISRLWRADVSGRNRLERMRSRGLLVCPRESGRPANQR